MGELERNSAVSSRHIEIVAAEDGVVPCMSADHERSVDLPNNGQGRKMIDEQC